MKIILTELQEDERQMIRKIARIQIHHLEQILDVYSQSQIARELLEQKVEEIGEDARQELMNNIDAAQTRFMELHEEPLLLFDLTEADLKMVRHILSNFKKHPSVSKLWHKMNVREYKFINYAN